MGTKSKYNMHLNSNLSATWCGNLRSWKFLICTLSKHRVYKCGVHGLSKFFRVHKHLKNYDMIAIVFSYFFAKLKSVDLLLIVKYSLKVVKLFLRRTILRDIIYRFVQKTDQNEPLVPHNIYFVWNYILWKFVKNTVLLPILYFRWNLRDSDDWSMTD